MLSQQKTVLKASKESLWNKEKKKMQDGIDSLRAKKDVQSKGARNEILDCSTPKQAECDPGAQEGAEAEGVTM